MPIKYTELAERADILDSSQHNLYFPSVTGVDGEILRLYHTHLSIPQKAVGHIIVKILGQSLGFRGGLTHENTLNVSFYETVNADVLRSLYAWLELVRNSTDDTSPLKRDYSQHGEFFVYDTTGRKILSFKLLNMFPISIEYPEWGEENAPAEITVVFNVDRVEMKTLGGTITPTRAVSGTSSNLPRLQAQDNSGTSDYNRAFTNKTNTQQLSNVTNWSTITPAELIRMLN